MSIKHLRRLITSKVDGEKYKPIYQEFGCDIDYSWQLPLIESWIKQNQKHIY